MGQSSIVKRIKQGLPLLATLLFMIAGAVNSNAAVQDSVGVKVKNGKLFIMHKVDPGQGLFAVSRRYNVPIEDILSANPEVNEMLQKGQILLIPTGKDAPFEEQVVKEYFDDKKEEVNEGDEMAVEVSSTFARYHTVQVGETLFSIAKRYKTSVGVIKDLNGLTADDLSENQRLLVPVIEDEVSAGNANTDKSKKKEERITELEEELVQLRKRIHGEEANDTAMKAVEDDKRPYEKVVDKVEKYNVEKVSEKGNVVLFTDNTVDQQQRYASHHEAEIGTIIMVSNPNSGQSVFVKVVRNHELNEGMSNMIIITTSAASKISVSSGSVVEISYAR